MASVHACTITISDPVPMYNQRHLVVVTWEWTSSDSGQTVTAAVTTTPVQWTGYVAHFTTKPGSPTPSSYNITLKDSFGRTLASKSSASTTAVETHTAGFYITDETLEIAIDSAGTAKQGTATAHIII